jgi:hypothetical protein
VQFAVTERSATGLATAWHPSKQVWIPRLYLYCGDFSVIEGRGTRNWAICIVPDGALVAPEAANDPKVIILTDPQLETPLSGGKLNQVNRWLADTDMTTRATTGMTLRELLRLIAIEMGHSDAVNPDNWRAA